MRRKKLKTYIDFVMEKNLDIYFSEKKNNRERFYENILDVIKNKDLNLLELTGGLIYLYDKDYISRNLEEILLLPYGEKVLELASELESLERVFMKSFFEFIN